jgi:hypothetical protein
MLLEVLQYYYLLSPLEKRRKPPYLFPDLLRYHLKQPVEHRIPLRGAALNA